MLFCLLISVSSLRCILLIANIEGLVSAVNHCQSLTGIVFCYCQINLTLTGIEKHNIPQLPALSKMFWYISMQFFPPCSSSGVTLVTSCLLPQSSGICSKTVNP